MFLQVELTTNKDNSAEYGVVQFFKSCLSIWLTSAKILDTFLPSFVRYNDKIVRSCFIRFLKGHLCCFISFAKIIPTTLSFKTATCENV